MGRGRAGAVGGDRVLGPAWRRGVLETPEQPWAGGALRGPAPLPRRPPSSLPGLEERAAQSWGFRPPHSKPAPKGSSHGRALSRPLLPADIYEQVCGEMQKKGYSCECMGGGRISHQSQDRKIHVYGYSMVSLPALRAARRHPLLSKPKNPSPRPGAPRFPCDTGQAVGWGGREAVTCPPPGLGLEGPSSGSVRLVGHGSPGELPGVGQGAGSARGTPPTLAPGRHLLTGLPEPGQEL